MECKYRFIKQDIFSFRPKYSSICTRCGQESPFPECDEECCTYLKEKQEKELRNNPPPNPGFRRCPFMRPDSGFQCSIELNNCSTCGINPEVKKQREKALAEQKRLKEKNKLSNKIKKLFKKKGED